MELHNVAFTIFLSIVTVAQAQKSIRAFDATVNIPHKCVTKDATPGNDDKYFFCSDKPEYYPQDNVDAYIQELHKLVSSEDDYDEMPEDSYTRDPSCAKQMHKNCCSESKNEMPYFVKSENQMKLVIQSKFFQQTIKVTKCAYEGVNCFEDLNIGDYAFNTNCVTNYGTTKLLVFNSITNEVETVPATFPVSCSCVITKN